MLVAFGRLPTLSLTMLGVEACAVTGDKCATPIILHDSASRGTTTNKLFKKLYQVTAIVRRKK